MTNDVISTYVEFLNALERHEKSITVTAELYDWLNANISKLNVEKVKGVPVAKIYGVTVYKEDINENT